MARLSAHSVVPFCADAEHFVDLYGILEYFVGQIEREETDAVIMRGGHDEEAKKIALQGKNWAEQALRKEDMLVYVLR